VKYEGRHCNGKLLQTRFSIVIANDDFLVLCQVGAMSIEFGA
jgi:hypothetical protein